jgi:hypothetical protein
VTYDKIFPSSSPMAPRLGPYTRMAQILAEEPQRASMAPRVAGVVTWRPYASVSVGVPCPTSRSGPWSWRTGAGGVRDWAGQ